MPTATHRRPGYRATQTGNELRLHNVPIFVECQKGDFKTDAKWINAAVDNAMQQQRDNYFPPLHYVHHGDGNVEHAGWFEITKAGPITLKSKRLTAVYADLVITNPHIAELVIQKRIPYRSIEVFDPSAEPAIDTLALLDHEPPFHELPMLFVSDITERDGVSPETITFGYTIEQRDTPHGVVACFRKIRRTSFSAEEQMTETTTEDPKQTEDFGAGVEPNPDPKAVFEKEDEESEEMEGGTSVDSICKAIESGEISVADMDKIIAAIQAQTANSEQEVSDETAAPAAVPGEAMKKDQESANQFAKMQAKIDALEAKDAQRDEAEVRKDDVIEALQRLAGRPLGADPKEKLTAFHKAHGPVAFKTYVDTLVDTFGELPDTDPEKQGFGKAIPEVAMKYQAEGPDRVERAARFAKQWSELKAVPNNGMKVTQERYVEINMNQTVEA